MEYLGLLATYFGTSVLTTRVILKNTEVISIKKIIAQATIITVGIVLCTLLLNMLRTYRTCDSKNKTSGVGKGFGLGMIAAIFAVGLFILTNVSGVWVSIISAILPVLNNYIEIIRGLGVALIGFIGYWIGRIFISMC